MGAGQVNDKGSIRGHSPKRSSPMGPRQHHVRGLKWWHAKGFGQEPNTTSHHSLCSLPVLARLSSCFTSFTFTTSIFCSLLERELASIVKPFDIDNTPSSADYLDIMDHRSSQRMVDGRYSLPPSNSQTPTYMTAARLHNRVCACSDTGHVKHMFYGLLEEEEKAAKEKRWGEFLVDCMPDSDEEDDDRREYGGRSSSRNRSGATVKEDGKYEFQETPIPHYTPNSGTTHNIRLDIDMHLLPEYDDRLNVDEVNVHQFMRNFNSLPSYNPAPSHNIDGCDDPRMLCQEDDRSGLPAAALMASPAVDGSMALDKGDYTFMIPAPALAPEPRQHNKPVYHTGGRMYHKKPDRSTKIQAVISHKAGRESKKATARDERRVRFSLPSGPTKKMKKADARRGAGASTPKSAMKSTAVTPVAGPSNAARRSTRARVTVDIEKWTTPLTERAPRSLKGKENVKVDVEMEEGDHQQGNTGVSLTVDTEQAHITSTVSVAVAPGTPAPHTQTTVTVGAAPTPTATPVPPTVASNMNSMFHYQPLQGYFVPYHLAAPMPAAIASAGGPYAPAYPPFSFPPVLPPRSYVPVQPASVPSADVQPGAGPSVLPATPAPSVVPSQTQVVLGGSNAPSQSATQSVPVQPTQPITGAELIWCGYIEDPRWDNNLGCRMNYRCNHLIRKTKQAIEAHYALVHGTNIYGSHEKCRWGSECKHRGRGNNLGNHILDKHFNGGLMLCEGKGCKLQRVKGTRWCASKTCRRIAPVWENREPFQQAV